MARIKRLKDAENVIDYGESLEGILTSSLTRVKAKGAKGSSEDDTPPFSAVVMVWAAIRVLSRPGGPKPSVLRVLVDYLRDSLCSRHLSGHSGRIRAAVLGSTQGLSVYSAEYLWGVTRYNQTGSIHRTRLVAEVAGEADDGEMSKKGVPAARLLAGDKDMLAAILTSLATPEVTKRCLLTVGDGAQPVTDKRLGNMRAELSSLLPESCRAGLTTAVAGGGLEVVPLNNAACGVSMLKGRAARVLSDQSDYGSDYETGLLAAYQDTLNEVVGGLLLRAYQSVMRYVVGLIPTGGGTLLRRLKEVSDVHRLSTDEMHVFVLVCMWSSEAGWIGLRSAHTCYHKNPTQKPGSNGSSSMEETAKVTRSNLALCTFLADVLWTDGDPSPASEVGHRHLPTSIKCRYLKKGTGLLVRKGVIDPGHESQAIDVPASILEYLAGEGVGGETYTSTVSCSIDTKVALPLEKHRLKPSKVEALLSTLRRGLSVSGKGTHILLHGLPGSGKTELAKSLAAHLGVHLSQPATGMSSTGPDDLAQVSPMERIRMLRTISGSRQASDVILVDEADRTLNCGTEVSLSSIHSNGQVPKEILNEFLDSAPGAYIWIVNATWWIPGSVMRRFDYVLKASLPDQEAREGIATTIAERVSLSCPAAAQRLTSVAMEYPLTPAGIYKLAGVLATDPTASKGVLEEVAVSHLECDYSSEGWRRERTFSASSYDPSFVNVVDGSYGLSDLEARAKRFLAMPDTRRQAIGLLNLNVLLYGPPGTGKTEWARHLAGALKRPLVEVTASSLIDKYVGGTEGNIREAFSKAEERGAVLLVDEADAILGSREGADRSYEISQVEQFLYSMENYKGILLCTTNFEEHLDKALLRRFYASVRFGHTKADVVPVLLEKTMAALGIEGPVREDSLRSLRGLSLTPSDFGKAGKVVALADEVTQETLVATIVASARTREGTRRLGL